MLKQTEDTLEQRAGRVSPALDDRGREKDFFRSVDSAPQGVSVNRPRSVTDGFLISFAALTALALAALTAARAYFPFDIPVDLIVFTADRGSGVLPVRTFLILFFLTYAAYAYASVLGKLKLAIIFAMKFAAVCFIVDGAAWASWRLADGVWPIHLQQLLVGLLSLAIFPHTLISNARLPDDSGLRVRRGGRLYQYVIVLTAGGIAALIAIIVATVYFAEAEYLRSIAILGGMGPGVFLAQQLFIGQLATVGWIRNILSRRRAFSPPVSVLIPAHNEAHQIRDTIRAIDAAAERYDGEVHVVVAENCSSDATARLAETALAQCEHIASFVVDASDIPGKARALNRGLGRIAHDFVVRIDADTIIHPDAIVRAMRHFANARVGGVGGLPLPHEDDNLLTKVRSIEVLLRHGFVQVAFGAFGGVFGLPGMFVIYRKSKLDEAGGFAEGMNGEDTDITLRMTTLGSRMVADPTAKFYTETPDSLAFLREQRTRWFRSLYHVTAHNRSVLFSRASIIGSLILPFTLLNGARRAMMAPLLIFGMIVFFIYGGEYIHPNFATVVAVVLGMPFVMALTVILVWRRFDLLIYVPLYMGFRFLRSYYTLGSTLSLIYPRDGDKRFRAGMPRANGETSELKP
ncbi:MAG: glycosyltransferase [Pseudomonadota bacterium]